MPPLPDFCPNCEAPVEQRHDVGRPRIFCRDACRVAFNRTRDAERLTNLIVRLTAAVG